MKTTRLFVASLAVVIALPLAAFAAKGDRKKNDTPPAFSTIDKEAKGSITEAQYVAAMKDTLGEEGAKAKFAALDTDKSGTLSETEYAAGASQGKKRRKKDAN
jgi:Ca2+-binding EF-hand superfamily protein